MTQIDPRSFRHLMGCFATGIAVATINDPELGRIGITINSLTSVSLTPPMVLFCLDKKAHIYAPFKRANHFAINILEAGQEDVSQHFANYRKFAEPAKIWDRAKHGCPIIKGTLGWAVCRKAAIYKGGDHSIFLTEVIDLKMRETEKKPILYFRGRYRKISG